jgi:uncharacterized protein YuzE
MKEEKSVTAAAKYDYDSLNDTFYTHPLDRDYSSSMMMDDIIIDMDAERRITGIEVLNASKKFGVSKYEMLHPMQLSFTIDIDDGKIILSLNLTFMKRNNPLAKSISVTGANDMNLSPSSSTFALA